MQFHVGVTMVNFADCVVPENIHISTKEGFFGLYPPTPPENSSLALYFPLIILAFETPPSPLEFLVTFLGVGMDIFWNQTLWYYQTTSSKSRTFHYIIVINSKFIIL